MKIFSVNAADLFLARTCNVREGLPSWMNLDFSIKQNVSGRDRGGCGLYCVSFDGKLIYVGKFQGQVGNPFDGDIIDIRWRRHLQSLTMRGEGVSVGMKTLLNAKKYLPDGAILSGLLAARQEQIIRDRGYHASTNRVRFAAMNWSLLGGDPDEFIRLYDFGYVKIDPAEVAGCTEKKLRDVVSIAEVSARADLSPPCNGESVFEESIACAETSLHNSLETLQRHLEDAIHVSIRPNSTLSKTSNIKDEKEQGVIKRKKFRLISLGSKQKEFEQDVSMEKIEEDLPGGWPSEWLQQVKTELASDAMEVHSTATPPRGDVRVRALNLARTRNVFTMQWQPAKEVFLCRILLDAALLHGCPGITIRTADAYGPLKTEFAFNGSDRSARASLLQLVRKAIEQVEGAGQ